MLSEAFSKIMSVFMLSEDLAMAILAANEIMILSRKLAFPSRDTRDIEHIPVCKPFRRTLL